MTNFEKIKKMSVEEMAMYSGTSLSALACEDPFNCPTDKWIDGLSPCEQCVKRWLESEVKQ